MSQHSQHSQQNQHVHEVMPNSHFDGNGNVNMTRLDTMYSQLSDFVTEEALAGQYYQDQYQLLLDARAGRAGPPGHDGRGDFKNIKTWHKRKRKNRNSNMNNDHNRNRSVNRQNSFGTSYGNDKNIDTSDVKQIMDALYNFVREQIKKAGGKSTQAAVGIAGVTPPSEGIPRLNQSRNRNENSNENGVNTKENCAFLCPLTPVSATTFGSILHDVFGCNSSLNDDNLGQQLFDKLRFCTGFESLKTMFIDYLKSIDVIEGNDGDKNSNYQLASLFMSKIGFKFGHIRPSIEVLPLKRDNEEIFVGCVSDFSNALYRGHVDRNATKFINYILVFLNELEKKDMSMAIRIPFGLSNWIVCKAYFNYSNGYMCFSSQTDVAVASLYCIYKKWLACAFRTLKQTSMRKFDTNHVTWERHYLTDLGRQQAKKFILENGNDEKMVRMQKFAYALLEQYQDARDESYVHGKQDREEFDWAFTYPNFDKISVCYKCGGMTSLLNGQSLCKCVATGDRANTEGVVNNGDNNVSKSKGKIADSKEGSMEMGNMNDDDIGDCDDTDDSDYIISNVKDVVMTHDSDILDNTLDIEHDDNHVKMDHKMGNIEANEDDNKLNSNKLEDHDVNMHLHHEHKQMEMCPTWLCILCNIFNYVERECINDGEQTDIDPMLEYLQESMNFWDINRHIMDFVLFFVVSCGMLKKDCNGLSVSKGNNYDHFYNYLRNQEREFLFEGKMEDKENEDVSETFDCLSFLLYQSYKKNQELKYETIIVILKNGLDKFTIKNLHVCLNRSIIDGAKQGLWKAKIGLKVEGFETMNTVECYSLDNIEKIKSIVITSGFLTDSRKKQFKEQIEAIVGESGLPKRSSIVVRSSRSREKLNNTEDDGQRGDLDEKGNGFEISSREQVPIVLDLRQIGNDLMPHAFDSNKRKSEVKKEFFKHGVFSIFFIDLKMEGEKMLDELSKAFFSILLEYWDNQMFNQFATLKSLLKCLPAVLIKFYNVIIEHALKTTISAPSDIFEIAKMAHLENEQTLVATALNYNKLFCIGWIKSCIELKYFVMYVERYFENLSKNAVGNSNSNINSKNVTFDLCVSNDDTTEFVDLMQSELSYRENESKINLDNIDTDWDSVSDGLEVIIENIQENKNIYVKKFEQYATNKPVWLYMEENTRSLFIQSSVDNRLSITKQIEKMADSSRYRVKVDTKPPEHFDKARGKGDKKKSKNNDGNDRKDDSNDNSGGKSSSSGSSMVSGVLNDLDNELNAGGSGGKQNRSSILDGIPIICETMILKHIRVRFTLFTASQLFYDAMRNLYIEFCRANNVLHNPIFKHCDSAVNHRTGKVSLAMSHNPLMTAMMVSHFYTDDTKTEFDKGKTLKSVIKDSLALDKGCSDAGIPFFKTFKLKDGKNSVIINGGEKWSKKTEHIWLKDDMVTYMNLKLLIGRKIRADSLIFVIGTHGDSAHIETSDNKLLSLVDHTNSLDSGPAQYTVKMRVIDACRGLGSARKVEEVLSRNTMPNEDEYYASMQKNSQDKNAEKQKPKDAEKEKDKDKDKEKEKQNENGNENDSEVKENENENDDVSVVTGKVSKKKRVKKNEASKNKSKDIVFALRKMGTENNNKKKSNNNKNSNSNINMNVRNGNDIDMANSCLRELLDYLEKTFETTCMIDFNELINECIEKIDYKEAKAMRNPHGDKKSGRACRDKCYSYCQDRINMKYAPVICVQTCLLKELQEQLEKQQKEKEKEKEKEKDKEEKKAFANENGKDQVNNENDDNDDDDNDRERGPRKPKVKIARKEYNTITIYPTADGFASRGGVLTRSFAKKLELFNSETGLIHPHHIHQIKETFNDKTKQSMQESSGSLGVNSILLSYTQLRKLLISLQTRIFNKNNAKKEFGDKDKEYFQLADPSSWDKETSFKYMMQNIEYYAKLHVYMRGEFGKDLKYYYGSKDPIGDLANDLDEVNIEYDINLDSLCTMKRLPYFCSRELKEKIEKRKRLEMDISKKLLTRDVYVQANDIALVEKAFAFQDLYFNSGYGETLTLGMAFGIRKDGYFSAIDGSDDDEEEDEDDDMDENEKREKLCEKIFGAPRYGDKLRTVFMPFAMTRDENKTFHPGKIISIVTGCRYTAEKEKEIFDIYKKKEKHETQLHGDTIDNRLGIRSFATHFCPTNTDGLSLKKFNFRVTECDIRKCQVVESKSNENENVNENVKDNNSNNNKSNNSNNNNSNDNSSNKEINKNIIDTRILASTRLATSTQRLLNENSEERKRLVGKNIHNELNGALCGYILPAFLFDKKANVKFESIMVGGDEWVLVIATEKIVGKQFLACDYSYTSYKPPEISKMFTNIDESDELSICQLKRLFWNKTPMDDFGVAHGQVLFYGDERSEKLFNGCIHYRDNENEENEEETQDTGDNGKNGNNGDATNDDKDSGSGTGDADVVAQAAA